MVQDYTVNVLGVERVVAALRARRLVLVAEPATQITHDDVGGVPDLESEISQRDTVTRRGLPCDADGGFVQHQPALQLNRAGHLEHNCARPGGGTNSFAY